MINKIFRCMSFQNLRSYERPKNPQENISGHSGRCRRLFDYFSSIASMFLLLLLWQYSATVKYKGDHQMNYPSANWLAFLYWLMMSLFVSVLLYFNGIFFKPLHIQLFFTSDLIYQFSKLWHTNDKCFPTLLIPDACNNPTFIWTWIMLILLPWYYSDP